MMEAAQGRPWSDLQPELLGLVLSRLPSLADRVRLRAVCHPWRSNSLQQPLPLPFPWLTLPNGTFCSIPGGEVHRMPVPNGASCRGSVDNWLFLIHSDDECTLMNLFSKSMLELPNLATVWQREVHYQSNPEQFLYKLVAPSPLDSSPDSLVAALIIGDGIMKTLCVSQPPIVTCLFRFNMRPLPDLLDVAFLDGKLYVLSGSRKLYILEFCKNLGSNSNIKSIIDDYGDFLDMPECFPREEIYMLKFYLVECGGGLLVVKRFIRVMGPFPRDDPFGNTQTAGFDVLKADLHSNPCQWRRISELGGHALFVGQHGSKSLPATECCGSQEDCIYFIFDHPPPKFSPNPFYDCGVYNMRNGRITPLMSQTAAPAHDAGQWRSTWVFHAGAV
ncbi:hypothetical protein CFC21_107319 [Triticum aestivum]|uniref:KIB1-4 beta-propeller domain-containing protein n=4 Tax=Triticinae TaxID=1648030 RepID=A0A9R1NAH4_WHEAT|nr:uncharacterized protein LOC109784974 [Aegilops tauschii subsp. strangulata]XP_044439555.1 uncharacterized protein LOC123165878 isoform X1 [Triticum aestivum]XP_045087933.1 uncharacterized protein LOC109784974 [Aegilops tauschii subsp. strangulata]XP_045087934.1 uncharacterized protein LOC109784974 [Aegilops tauschii subsp. strangulata]KAF7014232.1 hypothetical protein CFC21_028249 [Triticum aestivum]KAF7106602.1 hypothetical protein CFC21_107319 [Triticum aestivum]